MPVSNSVGISLQGAQPWTHRHVSELTGGSSKLRAPNPSLILLSTKSCTAYSKSKKNRLHKDTHRPTHTHLQSHKHLKHSMHVNTGAYCWHHMFLIRVECYCHGRPSVTTPVQAFCCGFRLCWGQWWYVVAGTGQPVLWLHMSVIPSSVSVRL